MKTSSIAIFLISLLLLAATLPQVVVAFTANDARQDWYEAREESREAQEEHRAAKVAWAADKTPEKNQQVVDTGKAVLHAALDEAEAWLIWKNRDAEENPELPEELVQTIGEDVANNLARIDALRDEVSAIGNQFELGIVSLKMIGKYIELLTDVARDTGLIWVHMMNVHAETAETYEEELRQAAEGMPDNAAVIAKLDQARAEIQLAGQNIDAANGEYAQVRLPGSPMIRFSNGNNYLQIARGNLLVAHGYLNEAYVLMASGGR
jgi:hypothetical protein